MPICRFASPPFAFPRYNSLLLLLVTFGVTLGALFLQPINKAAQAFPPFVRSRNSPFCGRDARAPGLLIVITHSGYTKQSKQRDTFGGCASSVVARVGAARQAGALHDRHRHVDSVAAVFIVLGVRQGAAVVEERPEGSRTWEGPSREGRRTS